MLLKRLKDDLRLHRHYNASEWRIHSINFTHGWVQDMTPFAIMPTGDAVAVSQTLFDKYAAAVQSWEIAVSQAAVRH